MFENFQNKLQKMQKKWQKSDDRNFTFGSKSLKLDFGQIGFWSKLDFGQNRQNWILVKIGFWSKSSKLDFCQNHRNCFCQKSKGYPFDFGENPN